MTVSAEECQHTITGRLLYFFSATTINVGLLAILASLINCERGIAESIRRGFAIYLMLISGAIVLFTETIANPNLEQYGKIAGMVSLVCITISYKPEIFDDFMQRIATVITGNLNQENSER